MKLFVVYLRYTFLVAAVVASGGAAALSDAEVDKLFNDALEQSRSGDLGEAISAFQTILSDRPAAGRVRLELALANFRALNYAAAREEAQKVLADPATPDEVRRTINAFLTEIDNQDRKHLFTPFLSFGWIHDDNVNAGPSSSIIDLGVATLTLAPGSSPIEDDGVQINAGINHRYLFDNTVSVAGEQAAVAWLSQVSLFRNHYFDEDDFHLNVITVRTGPSLLVSRKWGLQLNGEFNHIAIGDDDIAIYGGFNPTLTFFLNNQLSLSFSGVIQIRDFDRGSDKDRDGEYYEGGGAFGYQLPNLPVVLRVGFSGFTEDADTARRSNDGWIANAGFNWQPVPKANVFFNYYHRDREYDGAEPIFAVRRDENEDRFVAGASYRLISGGTMDGLTVNFSYTNTDVDSNVPIFEFERDQWLVSLSKTF